MQESQPMVQLETVPRSLLPDCNIQPPGSNNNNNQKTPATSNANQKLTSDSLSGPDAAVFSNLKRWTEDMGNLCNIQAEGARVVTPPHNLEELLAVMAVRDEVNMGTIEQAIMASPWVGKFRAYLRRMKLEDDENILKFLILVQPLKLAAKTNNNEPKILGHTKLERVVSLEDQRRLFLDAVDTFLSEESEALLPLSSPALWQQLQDAAIKLRTKADESEVREAVSKLLEVRRDQKIWEDGIEPCYSRFLKQTPPPSITACL